MRSRLCGAALVVCTMLASEAGAQPPDGASHIAGLPAIQLQPVRVTNVDAAALTLTYTMTGFAVETRVRKEPRLELVDGVEKTVMVDVPYVVCKPVAEQKQHALSSLKFVGADGVAIPAADLPQRLQADQVILRGMGTELHPDFASQLRPDAIVMLESPAAPSPVGPPPEFPGAVPAPAPTPPPTPETQPTANAPAPVFGVVREVGPNRSTVALTVVELIKQMQTRTVTVEVDGKTLQRQESYTVYSPRSVTRDFHLDSNIGQLRTAGGEALPANGPAAAPQPGQVIAFQLGRDPIDPAYAAALNPTTIIHERPALHALATPPHVRSSAPAGAELAPPMVATAPRSLTPATYDAALRELDNGPADAAIAMLREVIDAAPDDARPCYVAAFLLHRRGLVDEATKLLKMGITREAAHPIPDWYRAMEPFQGASRAWIESQRPPTTRR